MVWQLSDKKQKIWVKRIHLVSLPTKHLSWWRCIEDVFRLRLQDVLIITNIFALTIHLQETYQDVFKTFSRHLQDILEKRLQDKKSSRRLQDLLQRYPQDIFKTYHQVKLFLLTVFEKYCKDSYLQNDLSRSHFWDISIVSVQNLQEW